MVQERDTYFLLVDQGMSFAEAARAVGISTRTGERWRNGRGASGRIRAYPPINAAPAAEPGDPSRYLREADRVHIADRLLEKATIRAIAAELGRSPSTISREVRRNGTILPNGRQHYRPYTAQRRADARRSRPKTGKIGRNPDRLPVVDTQPLLQDAIAPGLLLAPAVQRPDGTLQRHPARDTRLTRLRLGLPRRPPPGCARGGNECE